MKMKYLYISILVLSLACGASGNFISPRLSAAPVPVVSDTTVQMVVTGDLNIRTGAGETFPLVDKKETLHAGDVVTCYQFEVKGDSIWCRHERGWSNCRWLKADELHTVQ